MEDTDGTQPWYLDVLFAFRLFAETTPGFFGGAKDTNKMGYLKSKYIRCLARPNPPGAEKEEKTFVREIWNIAGVWGGLPEFALAKS